MTERRVPLRDSSGKKTDVFFRCASHELGDPDNSALTLSLLPSMFSDRPLICEGSIDALLLENVDRIQAILQRFFNWRRIERQEFYGPDAEALARIVEIEAPAQSELRAQGQGDGQTPSQSQSQSQSRSHREGARAKGVGCFFTGGLDSFYTLLTHQEEITHLVFVLGYDVPTESVFAKEVVERLGLIARGLGKELVVLETDLRKTSDRLIHWHMYHGCALAAAGQLLAPVIGKIYVPSTYTYEDLSPLGSHPLLDPLWSTTDLELVHHGLEKDRPQKALLVGNSELARQHLRVCWENRHGQYNCGECEKCIRTLVEFAVGGQTVESIPARFSLDDIERLPLDPRVTKFWRASLTMAQQEQPNSDLTRAIEKRLKQTPLKWLRSVPGRVRKDLKHVVQSSRIT